MISILDNEIVLPKNLLHPPDVSGVMTPTVSGVMQPFIEGYVFLGLVLYQTV